jgi:hypothetical protein
MKQRIGRIHGQDTYSATMLLGDGEDLALIFQSASDAAFQ